MLMAQALFPGDAGAWLRPPGLHLLALRQGRRPAQLRLQRDQVRPARFRPRPARRPRPAGIGVSLVSPGFVREAGMFADSGAKPPAGLGTARARRRSARRSSGRSSTTRSSSPSRRSSTGPGPPRARPARRSRPARRAAAPARGRRGGRRTATPKTSVRAPRRRQPALRSDAGHVRSEDDAMSSDSFGARSPLEVGGRAYEVFRLDALQRALRRRPPALLDQGAAGERAAPRGRRCRQRCGRRGDRRAGTPPPSPASRFPFSRPGC